MCLWRRDACRLTSHNTCPMCRQLASMWQQVQFMGMHSLVWPTSDEEKSALVRKLTGSSNSPNLKDRIHISKELKISFHRSATFFERLQGRAPKTVSFDFTQVKVCARPYSPLEGPNADEHACMQEFHHVKDALVFVCNEPQRRSDRCVVQLCRFRSSGDVSPHVRAC